MAAGAVAGSDDQRERAQKRLDAIDLVVLLLLDTGMRLGEVEVRAGRTLTGAARTTCRSPCRGDGCTREVGRGAQERPNTPGGHVEAASRGAARALHRLGEPEKGRVLEGFQRDNFRARAWRRACDRAGLPGTCFGCDSSAATTWDRARSIRCGTSRRECGSSHPSGPIAAPLARLPCVEAAVGSCALFSGGGTNPPGGRGRGPHG